MLGPSLFRPKLIANVTARLGAARPEEESIRNPAVRRCGKEVECCSYSLRETAELRVSGFKHSESVTGRTAIKRTGSTVRKACTSGVLPQTTVAVRFADSRALDRYTG